MAYQRSGVSYLGLDRLEGIIGGRASDAEYILTRTVYNPAGLGIPPVESVLSERNGDLDSLTSLNGNSLDAPQSLNRPFRVIRTADIKLDNLVTILTAAVLHLDHDYLATII